MSTKALALLLATAALTLSAAARADLPLGKTPPAVTLSGKDGGRVDGSPWNSTELRDRIMVLFYVDPDEKSRNRPLEEALRDAKFPRDRYGTVAIVNLAATWMPNFAIESTLKSKQEEFPHTIYVKDAASVLVKNWGLADDNSDVVVFDTDGTVLFAKDGALTPAEISQVVEMIRTRVAAIAANR